MPLIPIVYVAGFVSGVVSIPVTGKLRDKYKHHKAKKAFIKEYMDLNKDKKPTGEEPF